MSYDFDLTVCFEIDFIIYLNVRTNLEINSTWYLKNYLDD